MKRDPSFYRQAAAYIRQRGLARTAYLDEETGEVCTIGAMNFVAVGDARPRARLDDTAYDHETLLPLAQEIAKDMLEAEPEAWPFYAIVTWTDKYARDADDVAERLERVANRIERANLRGDSNEA